MDVYVRGKRIRVNSSNEIGQGGEANIFDIGSGRVAKIYKPPTHPDLKGFPEQQQAAKMRLTEHQKKLPAFPRGLPKHVISPLELAHNKNGNCIVGYTMEFLKDAEVLLRYANRKFREAGISHETVIEIFKNLHAIVKGVHAKQVIIGDFNDLNVMIKGSDAYMVDADSFQFGGFLSKVFTETFVDPLLCDPKGKRPVLSSPYVKESDWYAFTVMLMQCLLYVGPYGGIYKPKDKRKKVLHPTRPLKRITVFHPEVIYPKPALPYGILPDEILEEFHKIFEKDQRGEFPLNLLNAIRFTTCTKCGAVHARRVCPECTQAAPQAVVAVVKVHGELKAERVFWTEGLVVHAAAQNDKILWLYHEQGKLKREDKSTVTELSLAPTMRFRVLGNKTLIGQKGRVVTVTPDEKPETTAVDHYKRLPVFDTNATTHYWISGGMLQKDGRYGPEIIGSVLHNNTLFWVGAKFGFGFYRAGEYCVGFTFDAKSKGINDTVPIPRIAGQLIDATCVFADKLCWFFISTQFGGKTINQCVVIDQYGKVLGTVENDGQEHNWLSSIRGKTAIGKYLFAATDEGLVRVEQDYGQIVQTREYPDTDQYVDSGCHLFATKHGIYAVKRREIWRLTMAQ